VKNSTWNSKSPDNKDPRFKLREFKDPVSGKPIESIQSPKSSSLAKALGTSPNAPRSNPAGGVKTGRDT
jgi:hypothetical protein